jgi:hypothetical protein
MIHPGMTESCTNGVDDNCDNDADCEATSCSGQTCAGGGMCTGGVCVALTESLCNDGVDNNNNGLIDCADPDCPVNALCSDDNACTLGDRCVADGGCEKVGDFACMTPPAAQCWVMAGVCVPDAGATCQYTPMAGSCNDGLACTTGETCSSGTCGSGTPVPCTSPPGACFQTTGTCQEPAGACSYAPRPAGTGTCTDSNNCTINDTCAGDGGCAGTPVTCAPPTQCQNASTSCDTGGNCLYPPRTNQACDAGTGPGTCDLNAACNANPTGLFPFTPSNFTEPQLPAAAGAGFGVSCATLLNTSGTPGVLSTCVTMPPYSIITQGGESTLLIRVPSFTVNSGQTFTITGTRPVIFAVTGDVVIDGTIRVHAGNGPTACGTGGAGNDSGSGTGNGGGGGGGFGTAGAAGGTAGGGGAGTAGAQNGTATLIPLRGGCNGGGATLFRGLGGGGIQITASGSLTVANTIAAPGLGGDGAAPSAGLSGGGGGSGGAILLEAATLFINSSARLTANGGSGGEGSGGSAGANGNDGIETGSGATPIGGDNSTNGGNGGVGGGGTAAPGSGLQAAGNNDGAGGGGGAVGRIRFNASTSCTIATSGLVVSPAATSNGASGCP